MSKEEYVEYVRKRFARKVIASPDKPIVVHEGDCFIFSTAEICTCGLIHCLMRFGDDPKSDELYPKFDEDYEKHFHSIYKLEQLSREDK